MSGTEENSENNYSFFLILCSYFSLYHRNALVRSYLTHENIFFHKPLPTLQVFSLMTNNQPKIEKHGQLTFLLLTSLAYWLKNHNN